MIFIYIPNISKSDDIAMLSYATYPEIMQLLSFIHAFIGLLTSSAHFSISQISAENQPDPWGFTGSITESSEAPFFEGENLDTLLKINMLNSLGQS